MELLYDISANETEVNIRSFQPIDIYTFKLLTPIDGTIITVLDFIYDNVEEKHTLVFDGIISTSQTIYIKIFNSNIDFNKYGWVGEVSKIINITPQRTSKWVKKNLPDLYENSYKRKGKPIKMF